jgi:branched-chain amino acid transport system ATP-binding protein
MAMLEVRGLTVHYGGLAANDRVSLRVERGALVGLIGPNGAGKTTFIDAITGFTAISSGEVLFDGQSINDVSPHGRAHLGLSRTFQSLELFEDLTVRDNLLVAAEDPRWYSFLLDLLKANRRRDEWERRVDTAIEALELQPSAHRLPSDLSQGQRKLVGVARALAAAPKLLLLDEPAAGLDTAESQKLGAHLRRFLADGTAIFLIDHDMGLVLNVCDYIYVLDFGRIIAEGTPAQIRKDPAVIAAYLGETAGEAQAREGIGLAASRGATAVAEALLVNPDVELPVFTAAEIEQLADDGGGGGGNDNRDGER